MLIEQPVQAPPLGLFPATQARVRACLEAADEAALAGFHSLRDRLLEAARAEVRALRDQIVGLT